MFVGRETELEALRSAWQLAKAGKSQVVTLLAESEFGKTRIAQEFYEWLSTHDDALEDEGYWPDTLQKQYYC